MGRAVESRVTRRHLLRAAVLGGGSATLAAILAACGEAEVVEKTVTVTVTEVKEVVKEVPVETVVTKEVIKEVPVETVVTREVIKEVPVEIIKEVEVEKVVTRDVIREVEVQKVVTREVERLVDVRRGGTLIVRHTRDPQVGGIEGPQALAEVDKSIAFMISETLLKFDFEKVEPVPWLAESFEISPDGTFIDLTIRKGIKFHDGTDFNADAAVFNLNRVFMDDHPFHDTGVYPYTNWALLSHAEKLSDDVIRVFSGIDADPILGWRLTTEATYMTSPAAIERFGEDIDLNPVGTGPFKFDSFEPGVQLSLVRNDDYWNPDNEAFLDKVIYRIIPDAQAAAAEFRAGNIDVFPFALTPDILELRDDARFRLLLYATNTYFYLSSNNAIDPFDNRDFRRALSHAYDWKSRIKELEPFNQFLPTPWYPHGYGFNPDVPTYEYDPEKSRQILEDLGWKLGSDGVRVRESDGKRASFTIAAWLAAGTPVDDNRLFMQQNLKDIGIETEFWIMDPVRGVRRRGRHPEPGQARALSAGMEHGAPGPELLVGPDLLVRGTPAGGEGWRRLELRAILRRAGGRALDASSQGHESRDPGCCLPGSSADPRGGGSHAMGRAEPIPRAGQVRCARSLLSTLSGQRTRAGLARSVAHPRLS